MKTSIKFAAPFTMGAIILAAFLLMGCNTTKGAGQDIKAAGKGIENAADRNGAN
jgi:predicted small secreted protein